MTFEDFAAGTDNTIIVWASESPLRRVRFSIGASILTDQLGVGNPVNPDQSVECCRAQRQKIETACRGAFKREQSDRLSLVDADFEEPSPTD